ncbi:MAG: zinc ribbon domain-containing protein [Eubacteriales bacterium]|nr:zinc ribbon domain-containing protein [Eubacteriales bacterium]
MKTHAEQKAEGKKGRQSKRPTKVKQPWAYDRQVFRWPAIISLVGFVICLIAAKMSDELNTLALIGYIILSLGTIILLQALARERYRLGLKIPFPMSLFFPSYKPVDDYDDLTQRMSAFRTAYSEFMDDVSGRRSNSQIQNYTTQMLWHSLDLKKRHLDKLKIRLKLEANRYAYVKGSNGVRSSSYFDGRYNVEDAHEEIYAIRTFFLDGQEIKKIYNKEVAHYTFLSAQEAGPDELMCPNCGSLATKSNLLDGCDYCGTKFTIEDLSDRVASFGFRRDFQVSESKRKAIRRLIYPMYFLSFTVPGVYMGLFLPFLYVPDMTLGVSILGALMSAVALGACGLTLAFFSIFFILPVITFLNKIWGFLNTKLTYRSEEELAKEQSVANQVRQNDPLFSLQSFFGSLQNKLYAIHFAETEKQVNAFSDCNLSEYLASYQDVVDIETLAMSLDSYKVEEHIQTASVSVKFLLRFMQGGKLKARTENLQLQLEKNADCVTQAVCGPSILQCTQCGSSLSLMEGKTCQYCGHELDLRAHDWVITDYKA